MQAWETGPAVVYKASELRGTFARRSTEGPGLIASFTEEQLSTTTTAGGEAFYEHELEGDGDGEGGDGGDGDGDGGGGDRSWGKKKRSSDCGDGGGGGGGRGGGGKGGAGGAGSPAVPKKTYKRRSSTGTGTGDNRGGGGGGGFPTSFSAGARSPCSPKTPRRSRVKKVVASDGKCYSLPLCIREKGLKLHLYVSLRAHRVDGDSLFTDPSAENAPLQRPYGRADITRENLLALRWVAE
ncbi:unnamed protein product [Hapterophycus canaliculatus]